MASGIKSLHRIDAVDLDGRKVAVMVGWTDGGQVVLGIAPHGQDATSLALLNGDAQSRFASTYRTAMIDAAGMSS